MDKPRKVRVPRTRNAKGRMWATATLLTCLSFSLWSNVESGRFEAKSVGVSALPPIVAFLCSHLISYFSPRTKLMKTVIYGGFGVITGFAMYGSGYHIMEFVMSTGQPWQTAIAYVIITDAPMLLAAGILIERVSTTRSTTAKVEADIPAPTPQPAPVKAQARKATTATQPAKATGTAKPAKAAQPAKAAKAAKATVPAFKAPTPDITDDALEKEMLNA